MTAVAAPAAGGSGRSRAVATWLGAAVALALLVAIVTLAPLRYAFLVGEVSIAILYATSLNLLMGYGGMLSFGHAAYFALGAYGTALLSLHGWPMALAMVAGPLVAALGALIFGAFIVRTSHQEHAYFLMLTLAFSQLVYAGIYKWYALTRGDDGLSGITPDGWMSTPREFGLFVVVVVALGLFVMWRIVHSPFGMTLQAIRDNPQRAQFVGLPIRRYQLAAFVIAGLFAGVAGALYAYFSGTISPQIADWSASARPFLANTIGGIQSFWGPAIGTLIFEIIDSQASRYTDHSLLAVGLLSLIVGIWLPQGIVGLFRLLVQRWSPNGRREQVT
jgi:branched-chain amino acid transport system permease protein